MADLDLGNVLQQVESIRGARVQNQLGQQQIQGNVLAQRGSNQFNELLQQHFANPSEQSFNAIAAANPEVASQLLGLQTEQQQIQQVEAQRSVAAADAVLRSASPKALVKSAFPEFIPTLQAQGINIDDLSDDEVKSMAQEIKDQLTPIAGAAETKTFAPTTIVGPEGGIQRVIPQVRGSQLTNIPVGQAPVLSPEDASALALRQAGGEATIKTQQALEQARGLNQEQRENKFIDEAFAAVGELQDINRATELIELVNTSGFEAAKTAFTDFFGTTPGDVGELRRILAQNVLNGLAAFTGAISEGEREFLSSITTSIQQGNDVNKRNLARLKRIATNATKRGRRILERRAEGGDENAINALADFNNALNPPEQEEVAEEDVDTGKVTATGGKIFRKPDGSFVVRE